MRYRSNKCPVRNVFKAIESASNNEQDSTGNQNPSFAGILYSYNSYVFKNINIQLPTLLNNARRS